MTLMFFKIWLSTLLPLFILGHTAPFNKDEQILEKLFKVVAVAFIMSFIAMVTSLIWMLEF